MTTGQRFYRISDDDSAIDQGGGSASLCDMDESALHLRCHATYFGICDEHGVTPLNVVRRYTHPQRDDLAHSTAFSAVIYEDPTMSGAVLFWTDHVANDWCRATATREAAHMLLDDLTAAVDADRMLADS